MKPKVEKKRCKDTEAKRIPNLSESQTNIKLDDNLNGNDIHSSSIPVESPADKESSIPDQKNDPDAFLETLVDEHEKILENDKENNDKRSFNYKKRLESIMVQVRNIKKRLPSSDKALTKMVTGCTAIKKFAPSWLHWGEWSPLNCTVLWITISLSFILAGHFSLMKQRKKIYKQGEEEWSESYAKNLKSEKDDLDSERDELRPEINLGRSNEKDNFIQDPPQEENLKSITNDDDSFDDDLNAVDKELESEKEFEKPSKDSDSVLVKKFVSQNVNKSSPSSKNMDSDERGDVESVNESSN